MLALLQAAPPITISFPAIDWSQLIPQITGFFFNAVGGLLYGALRGMLLSLWSGLFFAIPHSLTDKFGPVQAMQGQLLGIVASSLVLSFSLLGLRTYMRGITGNVSGIFDHILGRVLVILPVIGALPWLIFNAIDIEEHAAEGVTLSAVANVLPEQTPTLGLEQLLALLIAAVLGIRLWFKLASNVVHVAVSVTWAPAALASAFVPESSWIASLWIREFVGRLIGGVLATIAVGIGMGIALTHDGVIVVSLVGGAFLAASDVIDWLARTPSSSLGGVLGRAAGMGLMAANLAGAAAHTSGAAVSPAGATTHMSDAQVAKFYGYSSD